MTRVSNVCDKSQTITIYGIITIISLTILFNILIVTMEHTEFNKIHYLSSQSHLNTSILNQTKHISNMNTTNTTNINPHIHQTLPLSHIPKQNMIPLDELLSTEFQKTKCKFKGKLFILGVSK
eukprot:855179_1